MSRPAYRYLEPDKPTYGSLGRGIRWGVLLALPLWVLIFLVGFLISRL